MEELKPPEMTPYEEAIAIDASLTQLKKLAIFTAAVFLIISATLVSNQHLYFMAALLLVLPVVSYFIGMLSIRGLEVHRQLPISAWEGETGRFALSARSDSKVPRLFLQVDEHLPKWIVTEGDSIRRFSVPAGETVSFDYPVRFDKRGHYKLQTIRVTALDPLGLVSFSKEFEAPGDLLVYPVPQEVPDAVLAGGDRFGFRDVPTNSYRGSGVDPDGVREYVPGDPLRRMHWKSTARTGKLSVIEFEEPRAVNLCLVLDLKQGTDVGEGRKSTLEYLVRLAASLVEKSVRHGAAVRMILGSKVDVSGGGIDQLYVCLAALAAAEADEPVGVSDVISGWGDEGTAAQSVVILTADASPNIAAATAQLAAGGSLVSVFFADPANFNGEHTKHNDGFLESVLSSGATVWTLAPSEDDILYPEPVRGGHYANVA